MFFDGRNDNYPQVGEGSPILSLKLPLRLHPLPLLGRGKLPMRYRTLLSLLMLAALMRPEAGLAIEGKKNNSALSPSQEAAQEEFNTLVPDSFYKELAYNPNPLKAQVQLKKPKNIDRIKKPEESLEEKVIKRALSLDAPQKQAEQNEEADKATAASAGEQSIQNLMDAPLAPGATLNMGYRYVDYNKVGDSGIPFSTPNVPKADYYGNAAEGHERSAHEISFGVKVDLK